MSPEGLGGNKLREALGLVVKMTRLGDLGLREFVVDYFHLDL
jgi:hypothetical protein